MQRITPPRVGIGERRVIIAGELLTLLVRPVSGGGEGNQCLHYVEFALSFELSNNTFPTSPGRLSPH